MITVSDRVLDSHFPLKSDKPSLRELRKVVVIQVKGRTGSRFKNFEVGSAYPGDEVGDLCKSAGQVLGTRVVDLKDGRVVFWFLKKTGGKNLGFEFSFLQGAAAAIVLLELTDRETIQATKELLREICKVFSIPVMLVVGENTGEDLMGSLAPMGLGEIASKVVSFTLSGREMAVPAS
ncbi:MAG: hypothetical protein WED04_08305 [Promethearchaeati archaeon SRVP18_Atabeyarchaeia-1]